MSRFGSLVLVGGPRQAHRTRFTRGPSIYDVKHRTVAELCLQYGLDMTKQNWFLDTACVPIGLRGNDNLYKKLLHLYQNPLDLIVLARNEVRRSLGRRDISQQ